MVYLVLCPLALGDVAPNRRSAHDGAARIEDGRQAERDHDLAAVFALAYRLIMPDVFAAPESLEQLGKFILPAGRNQDGDGFPHHLGRQVAI